jgi:two-component system, OmpR family, response regulator BaeR
MTQTVFVVEDDAKIAGLVADYLKGAGYRVELFHDARSVIDRARAEPPQAVILDVMLPAGDGMKLCAGLREFSAVPILMLTARVDERDVLYALEIGADDYVTKPFSPRQVVARVGAMIRRADGRLTQQPRPEGFTVNEEAMRIAWRGEWLDLSPYEYRILAAMARFPERVFSRDQLLDALGRQSQDSGDRAIDSHIKNIRRKIAAVDPEACCVASVYGAGYRVALD